MRALRVHVRHADDLPLAQEKLKRLIDPPANWGWGTDRWTDAIYAAEGASREHATLVRLFRGKMARRTWLRVKFDAMSYRGSYWSSRRPQLHVKWGEGKPTVIFPHPPEA